MLKSELVERISVQNPDLYRANVEKIIDAIFDTIITAMARGDRVELRGFRNVFTKTSRSPNCPQSADWRACSDWKKGFPLFQGWPGDEGAT